MRPWTATAGCVHVDECVYAGIAPRSPGLVDVVVVCSFCRRLGAAQVAYPAPRFAGRPVGAG